MQKIKNILFADPEESASQTYIHTYRQTDRKIDSKTDEQRNRSDFLRPYLQI